MNPRFSAHRQILSLLLTTASVLTLPVGCGDPDKSESSSPTKGDDSDDETDATDSTDESESTDGESESTEGDAGGGGNDTSDSPEENSTSDSQTSSEGDGPDGGQGGQPTEPEPGLPPVPADADDSWTVLVYMNGDNDLEHFSLVDFVEMVGVPNNPQVNVLVQLDRAVDGPSPGYSSEELGPAGDFTTTKRFRVSYEDTQIIEDLGEVNMGDADTLAEFVEWGVKASETGHYGLVFWDHGGGWDLFGPDDSADHDGLELPEVAAGIASGLDAAARDVKLDFVGFDACLMATLETAQAVRPYASLLLASQELEPGTGWDWSALNTLASDPSASATDLGKTFVSLYGPHVGETRNATLSLVDLDKLDQVTDAVTALANSLAQVDPRTVGRVRAQTPEFATGHNKGLIDLGQFVSELAAEETPLQDAAQGVLDALDAVVVSEYHGPDAKYAHGLSLYFPSNPSVYDPKYAKLTGVDEWQAYLSSYLDAGEELGALAGFTNPDKIGDLGYEDGFLYITGNLADGTAAQLVSATLNFGIAIEDVLVFLGSNDGAWDENQALGAWDLTALVGSQGDNSAPFYYYEQYSSDSETVSFTSPVLYEGQYVLYYQLVLDSQFQLISEGYFGEIEGAIGQVEVPQSGTLQPILPAMDSSGAVTQIPLDTMFDLSLGSPSFSFESLETGTTVVMALEIADFGGNTDTVINVTDL